MTTRAKYLAMFLFGLLVAGAPAIAGTIKTWASNSVVTAADLNANFQHIHGLMVGGHGARLVDADVAANAAIQASKITGFTAPKAYGSMGAVCDSSTTTTCTSVEGTRVTSVTATSVAGTLSVTLNYTPVNANFGVLAFSTSAVVFCSASALQTAAPQFTVLCRTDSGAIVNNMAITFAVFDQ